MIISLGYRVRSGVATRFRKWASERLKEYMIKGFTINDNRIKGNGGGSYWRELLDRIRDIRSSEKVMYRQVLDLYATSVDYNPKSEESVKFFKIVQDKLHYAIHGNTTDEVIFQRADAEKPFMGLTSFSGELPTFKDTSVATNYLNESELKILNNLVSGYFDLAEINAIKHKPMYMEDYVIVDDINYSLEHIRPHSLGNKDDSNSPEFSIGNVVVLEESINHDLDDKPVADKISKYKNSSYLQMKETLYKKYRTYSNGKRKNNLLEWDVIKFDSSDADLEIIKRGRYLATVFYDKMADMLNIK